MKISERTLKRLIREEVDSMSKLSVGCIVEYTTGGEHYHGSSYAPVKKLHGIVMAFNHEENSVTVLSEDGVSNYQLHSVKVVDGPEVLKNFLKENYPNTEEDEDW